MHRRCCLPTVTSRLAASPVLYATSCKYSLMFLRMGEIIARNMLTWLELSIKSVIVASSWLFILILVILVATYNQAQFADDRECNVYSRKMCCRPWLQNTELFEIIVGVLTTCHTQYTRGRRICFFLFNRTTLQVFVTYLTGALYMHPLWFYKHQHDNRVRSKLFVAGQRWWFQWRFWFVPSVPGYLREEEEHKPDPWRNPIERNHTGLHLENEVAVVKTPTIISNNSVLLKSILDK